MWHTDVAKEKHLPLTQHERFIHLLKSNYYLIPKAHMSSTWKTYMIN